MAEPDKRAGKYLTFILRDEVYGIEILRVQEIIGIMEITSIPRTPVYIRGVINLRGKVIPVVDLRSKFALETQADTEKTCIIVVQVVHENNPPVTMGILVDEVSEVLNIESELIEDTPNFGNTLNTDFILGVGKVGQKVIMMLDVNRVLSAQEVIAVSGITK